MNLFYFGSLCVNLQKLEKAAKTGVLSLREHKLDDIPETVYE
jgi:hypothetical protein